VAKLRAVTFDWWGTLYVHRDVRERRLQALGGSLAAHGCAPEQVEAAYDAGMQRLDVAWRSCRVYHPKDWLADILADLGVELPEQACAYLQGEMEEAILATPPLLVPGAAELLASLHGAGVRLGLISDTGITVGRAMVHILEDHGIRRFFDAFSFSDETGVYKPQPKAFLTALEQMGVQPEEAVHVGDLPETDMCGAREVGMRPVLITGVSHRQDDGCADAAVESFAELADLFHDWGLLPRA
jgi:putative hydrolase of the HAD superfamily